MHILVIACNLFRECLTDLFIIINTYISEVLSYYHTAAPRLLQYKLINCKGKI